MAEIAADARSGRVRAAHAPLVEHAVRGARTLCSAALALRTRAVAAGPPLAPWIRSSLAAAAVAVCRS